MQTRGISTGLKRSISSGFSRYFGGSVFLGAVILLSFFYLPAQQVTYDLLVSVSADRSSPIRLESATVEGNIFVFVSPETGITSVRFFLDDPGMTGTPLQIEIFFPYDMAGTEGNGSASPFDSGQLAPGSHTVTAEIALSVGGTDVVTSTFAVALPPPDQVHLAWVADPSTTLTVIWRTRDTATPSLVEYRASGETVWQSATGAQRPSGTSGTLHEVALAGLAPSTAYEYRVIGDGLIWSQVFTTRTAPPPGPADFDAIYVADTGIVGRSDGLATGTQQVIDEIANLNPLLVLLGGDYAYFDTDKRFGTLENTIDAWFNQMQPVGTQSPMMPTYGDHEILLGEGFDVWAARFATPQGFDSRRNFSFAVGDVHFVSIMAVENTVGLSAATLAWIEQDITAAFQAGRKWVIPYFHVSPFADGTNHLSNLALRGQLGPLFERLGVKLVLASHDQAYERTFPLTDVPATNTPTSASKACYTFADGVTWVKTSPGGKMSNINGSFSQFGTEPPPSWTAFRDNTMHHFLRLMVSASGSIRVEAYGIKGDGTPPVILDSFEYTTGTCPAELRFDQTQMFLTVDQGGSVPDQMVGLDTSDATGASFSVSDDADWLTVGPVSGSTPATLTLSVDATSLAAGTHTATVTATADGFLSDTLAVTVSVGQPFALMVSTSSDRASPVSLNGSSMAGDVYVFTTPDVGVNRVRFFLDDPAMNGAPRRTENNAPYDFAGGSVNSAGPFDTTTVLDGQHTITAAIDLTAGGTEVVSSTFAVSNNDPALSFAPDALSFSVPEGGTAPDQTVGLDTTDGTIATFTVNDDANWLTVSSASGTTPDTLTVSVDATGLLSGVFVATVTATAAGYNLDTLTVTLTVGQGFDLFVSTSTSRLSPVRLDGATASGSICVFTSPEAGVSQARFFLNGTAHHTENVAPFDFNGTAPDGTCQLFSTRQLPDGMNTITAEVDQSAGGTAVLTSTFTVSNGGGGGDPAECSPLPCDQILVSLPYELDYIHRHDHGAILDRNGVGTGFTYIDPPSNGVGYIPENLFVDLTGGVFQITTTNGLAARTANSLDNGLAVGIDAPSQVTRISATLLNPPPGTGNWEQAGLWFGNDEENYTKLIVISSPEGLRIEQVMELNGARAGNTRTAVLSLSSASVVLNIVANPVGKTVSSSYSINGGATVSLETFTAPPEFFSFDAAGIDQRIRTNSFGGIFASHRNGPSPLIYTFESFLVEEAAPVTPPVDESGFVRSSFPVPFPTSMVWGPDDRLYVTELFGAIHAVTLDENKAVVSDVPVTALVDSLGSRLTLGITVDPLSTPSNVILWVSHSSPSLNNGEPNSSTVSRISGPGLTTIEHIITGLPRALANHAVNSLHFGPDDKLYIASGGNTGAGAPNDSGSEFGTMEEQPLSAAILVADVRNPTFDGSCDNTADIFGPPPCDVVPYATGLRNAYDFVWHSNGSMYAPDNGLGVTGTFPPSPTPPCLGFGDTTSWTAGGDNPGSQPDILLRVQQGMYYGHPNPHRDECVFKDGSFQGVAAPANYVPPIFNLGNNRSADGTVEYGFDAFFGALKGELLIANFSVGDNITRIRLSPDGGSVISSASLATGFNDPLPLAVGPDGTIYVGEFGGNLVTVLDPRFGRWFPAEPMVHPRHELGVVAIGDKIYAIGGNVGSPTDQKVEEYDVTAGTWRQMADLPESLDHLGATVINNKIYVFGGLEAFPSPVSSDVYEFDPAVGLQGAWTKISDMPIPVGGMAIGVEAGWIYLAGGFAGNHDTSLQTSNFWRFNTATLTWEQLPDLPTHRDHVKGEFIGGKFYVVGGRQDGQLFQPLGTLEVYDPATSLWSTLPSMPTARRGIATTVLNGRLVVLGGEKNPDTATNVFEEVEEFDPVANSWRNLAPMLTPRHASGAVTVSGRIYSVGGATVEGGCCVSNVMEIFTFGSQP